ncbi:hypothetical protein ACHAXM_000814 [Skeletonema potamos]
MADEIERRSIRVLRHTIDVASENWAMENDGGLVKQQLETSTSPSTTYNNDQPTLQELDVLVNDIVNSSPKISQKDVSETTRQFDDIIKYDNFLKLLKS